MENFRTDGKAASLFPVPGERISSSDARNESQFPVVFPDGAGLIIDRVREAL
jgi:hypothetical protein